MITYGPETYLKGSNMNAARLEDLHIWNIDSYGVSLDCKGRGKKVTMSEAYL
jgi:hypothetical protein